MHPQVPWHSAARAFLRTPSLVVCRPETLSGRVGRLVALPGAGAERVRGALCSLPGLLFLQPATLEARWRSLSEV